MIKYNKNNISLAKDLRKNMTKWEKKLWYDYLNRYPTRFQRQKAIGNYIADFYCAQARLIIELDGEWHYDDIQSEKDVIRTKYLESQKLFVVRFLNKEIENKFEWVCEYIDAVVKQRLN